MNRWFLAAVDKPFELLEVDRGVFEQYGTRTGLVLAKDAPVAVDPCTGARIWRVPYARSVALAVYQTLVHGELCVDSVHMADLVRALEYEGVCVPGATSVRALRLGDGGAPRDALGFASRVGGAADGARRMAETVANALMVWPRLEHGLKHGTGDSVGFTCSQSRVWLRFTTGAVLEGVPTGSKDPIHVLASNGPRWLWTLLAAVGTQYMALKKAESDVTHNSATYKKLASLLGQLEQPVLDTQFDLAAAQRVHSSGTVQVRNATPEARGLLHAFNFAGRILIKVREYGAIVTDEQRESVPVDVLFARACCCLARDTREAAPRLGSYYSGLLAETAEGSTPEREALKDALKKRKIKVRKWADEPPKGVEPLVYPPMLRPCQGSHERLNGPSVLLEFL